MTPEALFVRDGERFLPTSLTRGGWSNDAQHGGPPVGLLARAADAHPTSIPMTTVRLTVDLIRPVPLTPLIVRTRLSRPGTRVQIVEGVIEADGVEVALARAVRIRCADLDLGDLPEVPWTPPPGPEAGEEPDWRGWGRGKTRFYLDAVDIRSIDATFEDAGPGLAWIRLRYPLVEGEESTRLVRVATLADMGNAVTRVLDHSRWLYVNPDLTLYVHRESDSEWIGFEGASYPRARGVGVADTLIFDRLGPIGRIVQAQLIDVHRETRTRSDQRPNVTT